jgi:F-type H+-transporting ATPase subunit b
MDATAWATVWVLLGFLVFLAILVYMRVPAMLTAALDSRAEKIKSELDDARRLREEAAALLLEYQKRAGEAEAEAQAIIAQAGREAEGLRREARARIEEYVARRTRAVEQRIAQAEAQAVAEVRSRAIDLATAAAARILREKADGQTGEEFIRRSIEALRRNLN